MEINDFIKNKRNDKEEEIDFEANSEDLEK
jgi:hypothetical protein